MQPVLVLPEEPGQLTYNIVCLWEVQQHTHLCFKVLMKPFRNWSHTRALRTVNSVGTSDVDFLSESSLYLGLF